MAPEAIFAYANGIALVGWLILTVALLLRLRPVVDWVCGLVIPVALSLVYLVLIGLNWGDAEGGFGSLAEVTALFRMPELLLAGWVHYLAFDLLVGAMIVRQGTREGMPRLLLLPVLPLTFLFGPIGFLLFQAIRALRAATGDPSAIRETMQ